MTLTLTFEVKEARARDRDEVRVGIQSVTSVVVNPRCSDLRMGSIISSGARAHPAEDGQSLVSECCSCIPQTDNASVAAGTPLCPGGHAMHGHDLHPVSHLLSRDSHLRLTSLMHSTIGQQPAGMAQIRREYHHAPSDKLRGMNAL